MKLRALRWPALLALAGLCGAAAALLYLQGQGVTPRALAPYIERRSAGHNPAITGTGQWVARTLLGLDRGAGVSYQLPPLTVGAQPQPAQSFAAPLARKLVASGDEARRAFAGALPGDAIVFMPGTYRIAGAVAASRIGTADAPIVVRAERPGTVVIEFDAVEGFNVSAPYWRFENLTIRGGCARQVACEHAFHVVGAAHHFVAVNNTVVDFNAHFKVNGDRNGFPDFGLIESNTLTDTAPRETYNPVTPVDMVAVNDWVIRRNLVTDFVKAGGDRISYGIYAKGAGARTLFEQNVVLCEQRQQGPAGQRIGLSFGGGGTGKQYCRDRKCITEQDEGVMRANLVAACSDVGIYLNSAARSRIVDNTLIDTGGLQVRYPESSAQVDGNLIDGAAMSRDGGVVRRGDNLETAVAWQYLGYHPLRKLFVDAAKLDLRWRELPPRRSVDQPSVDLCGVTRKGNAAYGAFEEFSACQGPQRQPQRRLTE